jgi:hypothetical protein
MTITGTLCEKVNSLIALITGWQCVEVPVLTGYANVSQDGTINASCGDFEITKTGVGEYQVTPPPGSETASLLLVEPAGSSDDVSIHLASSFTGGPLWIAEQDNGGNAGVRRDRPWSIKWYGKGKRVICE